jgi:hypothetical protein
MCLFVCLLTLRPLPKWSLQYCSSNMIGLVSLNSASSVYRVSERVNVEPCELLKSEAYDHVPSRGLEGLYLGRYPENTKLSLLWYFREISYNNDRLCGLVVRVLGYRSGGPGSVPGTTRNQKKSSCSGTGPLSLVSTTEELLDRKVAPPV